MNSLERVSAAVSLQQVDRTPVIPLVICSSAPFTGRKLIDYLMGGAPMANCLVESQSKLQYDGICIFADIALEAEAAGTRLSFTDNEHPATDRFAVREPSDIARLRMPDLASEGRIPSVLEACSLVRQSVDSEVAVIGLPTGPMSIAANMMEISSLLLMIADDPDAFSALLDFTSELSARYALALIEAGAHCVSIADPAGSPQALPKRIFREQYIPRVTKVIERIHQAGVAAGLFIWGIGNDTLPDCLSTGADVIHLDHQIDMPDALALAPDRCLTGNIKTYAFTDDAPEDIENACWQLLKTASGRNGFILASGGEVSLDARIENVAAMTRSVRS